jgi:hypothetical protein
MKNKQPFKLSDEKITEFDISEVVYENGQERFEVLLKLKGIKTEITLTYKDLENMLSEIEKCENDEDYYFENYISE